MQAFKPSLFKFLYLKIYSRKSEQSYITVNVVIFAGGQLSDCVTNMLRMVAILAK